MLKFSNNNRLVLVLQVLLGRFLAEIGNYAGDRKIVLKVGRKEQYYSPNPVR